MALAVFLLVALIAVGSAVGLVLRRNPLHGALFLVVNLFCVAVFYLMLEAEFLAAAQVIIYAGAIMVLFLFAIMVLIPGREELGADPLRWQQLLAVPLALLLLVEVGFLLKTRLVPDAVPPAAPGGIQAVGRMLFTDYLFPFEVTSVLLLAALVGVLVLTRRKA
jgi:NADH-quinone oxidoreductase subunit J